MVHTLERCHHDNKESLCSVARELGVDASQLRCWQQQSARIKLLLKCNNGIRVNANAASVHRGRKSCLHDIEEDLLAFIFEHREQGLVSIRMVTMKASQIDAKFRHKTARAKDHAVRRFVASHSLVHCVHTHQSQENIADVHKRARDWMDQMHPRLFGQHRDYRYIINMDQTPIFFSMSPRTTLEASGTRIVNVRTSTKLHYASHSRSNGVSKWGDVNSIICLQGEVWRTN